MYSLFFVLFFSHFRSENSMREDEVKFCVPLSFSFSLSSPFDSAFWVCYCFLLLLLLLLLLLSTILTYGLLWLFVCSFSVSHITKELLLCGHLESLMWMCAANSFLGSTITLFFHFWMGLNMGMGLQRDQIKTFCFYML